MEPAPTVETTRLRRRSSRDRLVAGIVLLAFAALVLKPWGSPAKPELQPALAQPFAAPSPSPLSLGPIAVPAAAFDPSAGACYRDSGWSVCMLDEGGAAGQPIHSWLSGPSQPRPATPTPSPAVPAVVLLTMGSAGIGFYAPPSERSRASGSIVVTAWRVDELTAGTRSLSLQSVGPLRAGPAVAVNVYVPPFELAAAPARWPAGRYVFRFQPVDGELWDQFFTVEVGLPAVPLCPACSTAAPSTLPPPISGPTPVAGTGASLRAAGRPAPAVAGHPRG